MGEDFWRRMCRQMIGEARGYRLCRMELWIWRMAFVITVLILSR